MSELKGARTAPRAALPMTRAEGRPRKPLALNLELTTDFLVSFLRDEVTRRKGFDRVVVPLSGGIDSAVTAYLAARAFGPENVHALRLPYRASDPDSLAHAQLVVDALGLPAETLDITEMVDAYARLVPDVTPHRLGNVMARVRMIVAFDKAAELGAVHLGTGNKTERFFGYYTWHDVADAAPVSPLGDLFKTQVRALAEHLGVPEAVRRKPPSADLVVGQSDEADLGISYERADTILIHHLSGYGDAYIESLGFSAAEIALVRGLVAKTHWKRALPIHAVVSSTAIGEFYLRPVDY
ncbi:NAD+ synthetase [Truepera radiovictrix DSM 17093]|uniref:NH(3)-dependent NAD(+) synthetase n=2 Tax=Truepera TaxID=332248 RepID=D7CRV9_TRURR|nr:NAD+ synthase [Truepera radiovictrix]ADI15287.1 NAD+ synthetase [Truepera radiovictrix DSM 17093]WMT56161.1 NAD+ synthase [Truepera radiovictrix]